MKKVLLIKMSSLGDVIFTVPLANCLKENGYEVHCLTTEKGIDIMKNNPCVDKVFLAPIYTWKKNNYDFKNLWKMIQLIFDLRKEKYDIAFDVQRRIKSLPFMRFCGAKRRIISHSTKEGSRFGANEFLPPIEMKAHVVCWNLDYAKYLGLDISKIKFTLPKQTDDVRAKVDDLLVSVDKTKPITIIAPATTWVPKHWDVENWKSVVQALKDKTNIIFTGTNADNDLINSIMGEDEFLNLAGKTNLHDLIELFSRVDLVIAPDSGSAHLAWASDKPYLIEIYCCTDYKNFGCYGNDEKWFSFHGEESCYPCNKRRCLKENDKNICTKSVKAQDVIDLAQKLLEKVKV